MVKKKKHTYNPFAKSSIMDDKLVKVRIGIKANGSCGREIYSHIQYYDTTLKDKGHTIINPPKKRKRNLNMHFDISLDHILPACSEGH